MQAVRGLITKTTISRSAPLFRFGATTINRMASTLHRQQQTAILTSLYNNSNNRAVIAQQYQQYQSRTFVSPSRILFAVDSADVDKGVQNITDLFMVARDEVLSPTFHFTTSARQLFQLDPLIENFFTPQTNPYFSRSPFSFLPPPISRLELISWNTQKRRADRYTTTTTKKPPVRPYRRPWTLMMSSSKTWTMPRSWTSNARLVSRSWNSSLSWMHLTPRSSSNLDVFVFMVDGEKRD